MIKADKKKWAELIFSPYEEFILKRNFSAFYLTGAPAQIKPGNALLITPNHFSWWDGFFIDYAIRKLFRKNFYILMLEEQLKKYPFFSKVGAFSINPGNYGSIKTSLNYAENILSNDNNVLVYYPQGNIEPYDKSPLIIKKGIFHLLKEKSNIDIIPAAFRIEYDDSKNPAVYFRFGSVLSSQEVSGNTELFQHHFNGNIKELNGNVISRNRTLNLFSGGG